MRAALIYKKVSNASFIIAAALMIASLITNLIPPSTVFAGNGAIWTTGSGCGTIQQDRNSFAIGETVYINGSNFDANESLSWDITGKPGGASCDPGLMVAHGSITASAQGAFCISAYTIAADDCGEYHVNVSGKGDNYGVSASVPTSTPTFTPLPPTSTPTFTPLPPTSTPTNTPLPPTNTPTDTPLPPTNTPTDTPEGPLPSNTPTDTPTNTPEIPTNTPTFTPTNTATNTPEPPTSTPTNTPTDTPTSTPTDTPTNTPTATPFAALELAATCEPPPQQGAVGGFNYWILTNPNGFDVEFEYGLAGGPVYLATIPALSSLYIGFQDQAGTEVLQIWIGGVLHLEVPEGACEEPTEPPAGPSDTPIPGPLVVLSNPTPVPFIPVTGGSAPIIIPVTGVAPSLNMGVYSRLSFTSGVGFFGLGLVLRGLARRLEEDMVG